MCGIVGGYWKIPPANLVSRLNNALGVMRRRGPDHQGFDRHEISGGTVALGHTRLSIIDLSEAGFQPMYSESKRFGVVYNGEIYNYIELRQELLSMGYGFRTSTDTEVLLAAWQQWGAQCLSRLKGMFAFALIDRREETLVCARDAFGIKPFFYSLDADGFNFGSELDALKALKNGKFSLNWQRAYDYLVHGEYDFGSECFMQGVFSLPPAHFLTVDLKSLQVEGPVSWWRPSIEERSGLSFEAATEMFRGKFLENVRLHLRSDVPIGAALSGGMDSSAIVCAIRHLESDAPINTFSYIAKDSGISEERWVDLVNHHVGAKSHKVVVTPEDLVNDLEDLIATQGEPFGSTSIYAQYRVFKLAKESGVTVTLDGQGADEILGGYNGYPGQRMRSLLDRGDIFSGLSYLNAWARWPGRSRGEGLKRLAGQYAKGPLYQALRRLNGMDNCPGWIRPGPLREEGVSLAYPEFPEFFGDSKGRRMMATLASSMSQRGLLGLLRHGDRNSMRFSIESRVPFLTTDMADAMLSLPEDYLVSPEGETKRLLRFGMRGIVPDAILDRRDKVGFATPEEDWLPRMADNVRTWLAPELGLPFLDQKRIREQFELVVSGRRPYSWQVWRWINFTLWFERAR
jgi:asparagine synthase (glutamine-hydrolysing)